MSAPNQADLLAEKLLNLFDAEPDGLMLDTISEAIAIALVEIGEDHDSPCVTHGMVADINTYVDAAYGDVCNDCRAAEEEAN